MNTIYKDALAQAFMELCTTNDVDTITVGKIVNECGVSRQTFYNHFKDKYEVMEYLFDKAASQATNAMFRHSGCLEEAIKEMLYVFQDNKSFYNTVAKMQGQNSFREFFCQYTISFYTAIVERLLGKGAVTPSIAYQIRFNAYGISHMVQEYMLDGMKDDPEVIAPLMVQCLPEELKKLFVIANSLNQTKTEPLK